MSDRAAVTMRAVTHRRYGGPDVLSVGEVPRPAPGPGELLVRVAAAEATKTDCEMRSFRLSVAWSWVPLRLLLGVLRPRSPVLGMYFAGVVAAVGEGVDRFESGDAVFGSTGLRRGAYGEYVAVRADGVVAAKPASMTFAEAAALPLGGMNALHFVRLAAVREGERVLVNGAGGVIGAHTVQIAVARGGVVTGVDAAHKESFVRAMGATAFVDFADRDVTGLDERFDVIVDMIPSMPVPKMLDLLRPGGRYAHGNPRLATMVRARSSPRSDGRRIIVEIADESASLLEDLAAMADAGEIRSIVDRVLPMEAAAEAHRLVETERRCGAIVLAIGDRASARSL